ncbi:hypothetical protein LCGC14_1253210 [marine sediment metagenome]|uniref:Uncharacterized protein n=1 Tax=marine sediment metagenome TaxID=412755 RepID=A0A0F9P6C3_9ZZZZ
MKLQMMHLFPVLFVGSLMVGRDKMREVGIALSTGDVIL